MANKTQLATVGEQQAAVVINNQFIDGLTKQLEEKCKYGLSFPKDYNLSNALMGAYLVLKETKTKIISRFWNLAHPQALQIAL